MFSPQFSDDSKLLCFLKPSSVTAGATEVWGVDTASGTCAQFAVGGDTEATLSPEEKLRRERARTLTQGATAFSIIPRSHSVLFAVEGSLVVAQPPGDAAGTASARERVVVERGFAGSAGGPCLDARVSPCGEFVAFVCDDDLWVARLDGG